MDFDGTIVDSNGIWVSIYKEYCASNSVQLSEEICKSFGCIPFADWIAKIKSFHNISLDNTSYLYDIHEVAVKLYCSLTPKHGFKRFVSSHKQDCIIIISKEDSSLISFYLQRKRIKNVHSIIQDKYNYRSSNQFYEDIANKSGYRVNEILLIDDSLAHCTTAKESGALVVGINDYHSIERQRQMRLVCDLYVNNFMEIEL